MTTNKLTIAFVLLLGMMIATLVILLQKPWQAIGSVAVGNQYQSTTTPAVADLSNLCPQRNPLAASSTTGVLGTIDITNYGSGSLQIYDATTSVASSRSATDATSTIFLWGMINGMATSSHPDLDLEFKRGLLIDKTGTVGTSTITYRCEG